jgi:hypothetical protein
MERDHIELLARLDERQKAFDEKFDAHQEEIKNKLDSILEQTTKTNGRVTSLEHARSRQKGAMWAIGIIGSLLGFAIAGLIEYFKK